MNGVIDFDKIFEEYALEWFKDHGGDYCSEEEMESAMPDIYEQWASSPSHKLGGIAPRAFFDSIEKPDELIKILIGTSEGESNPCSLLMDKIAETKACAPLLCELIQRSVPSVKVKMLAINLLSEMGERHPLEVYVSWLNNPDLDNELKELGIEILCEHANEVKDKLFEMIGAADADLKTLLAEILINADKDERTYNLLTDLFSLGDNLPLYASYIGKYGDTRSAAQLYRALGTCNYLDYIEIKNAIERMGGVVEDTRDFEDDEYFAAIKNVK